MSAKRCFHDDKGTTTVEFALILPFFLGMVFGIFWIGWISYTTNSIHHALAEGARALQLKTKITQSDLQTLVRSRVVTGTDAQNITVTLSFDAASGGTQLAHTTATYPLTFTVPLIGTYSINYTTSMTVPVTAT